jgi:hypothetical protein
MKFGIFNFGIHFKSEASILESLSLEVSLLSSRIPGTDGSETFVFPRSGQDSFRFRVFFEFFVIKSGVMSFRAVPMRGTRSKR